MSEHQTPHAAPTSTRRMMYTVPEAAALLGLGRSTAYELVLRGELDAVRIGRRWLVRRTTLHDLLGQDPPFPDDKHRRLASRDS